MDLSRATQAMNQASFSNFDGYDPDASADTFDPEMVNAYVGAGTGTTRKQARGGTATMGSFSITVTNTNTNAVNFELFNYMRSYERIANSSRYGSLVPGGSAQTQIVDVNGGTSNAQFYGYNHLAIQGAPATVATQDIVAWLPSGALIHNFNTGSNGNLTIDCQELPYRSLLEYTSTGALYIQKLRLEVSDSTQINRNIIWTKKNIFGVETSNNLAISRNKSAFQFQPNIVEINMPFALTAETALLYSIGGSQNLTLTFYVSSFVRPNI